MSIFIAENSKYIILILFLVYLIGCVWNNKCTDIMQKILIYIIHFVGFLCLLVSKGDIQLVGFYLLQILLISGVMIGYHLVYKKGHSLLANHICMFFVISMIMLTRISFGEAFRQFVFWCVGFCGIMILPLLFKKGELFRRY